MNDERPTTRARDVLEQVEQLNETKTAERIKTIAGKGLKNPETVAVDEVRELCGSVMAHIERHGPLKK